MLKTGDIVIAHGGGNKMRVVYVDNRKVKCEWICGMYFDRIFDLDEIILYENYTKAQDRRSTIENIINTEE